MLAATSFGQACMCYNEDTASVRPEKNMWLGSLLPSCAICEAPWLHGTWQRFYHEGKISHNEPRNKYLAIVKGWILFFTTNNTRPAAAKAAAAAASFTVCMSLLYFFSGMTVSYFQSSTTRMRVPNACKVVFFTIQTTGIQGESNRGRLCLRNRCPLCDWFTSEPHSTNLWNQLKRKNCSKFEIQDC